MNILEYGKVIMCRDITFEDNKYDFKDGHPGVVMLPTNEKSDNVYCLYMTSDKTRAIEEKNKFLRFKGKAKKESYINLQQIIKRKNIKEREQTTLREENFIELLTKFYDYQMNLEPKSEDFMQIKDRIKILLETLKRKQNLSFYTDNISQDELDELYGINNTEKAVKIYGVKLICYDKLKPKQHKEIENEFFITQKDKSYFNTLVKIYEDTKKIDTNKLNLQEIENELYKIYYSEKNKNYLINMTNIFEDLAILLRMTKRKEVLIDTVESIVVFQKEVLSDSIENIVPFHIEKEEQKSEEAR